MVENIDAIKYGDPLCRSLSKNSTAEVTVVHFPISHNVWA